MSPRAFDRDPGRRPRRWGLVLPVVLVILLAIGWSGFWYYAAGLAESKIAQLRARGAATGYRVDCGQQTIGGYPFRMEVRCTGVNAELKPVGLSATLKDAIAVAQIYQPTLVIAEMTAPLDVAEAGGPPAWTVNWTLAQASVRGLPGDLDRVSLVLDKPDLGRLAGAARENFAVASALRSQ